MQYLRALAINADDHLDAARQRLDARFGFNQPRYIAAYRSFASNTTVELRGRVLASAPLGGPLHDDTWWDNLLNTYRRFDADDVPGVGLRVRYRDATAETVTDSEGYYKISLPNPARITGELWENANITLDDGSLPTSQPVLQVSPSAQFGVISDIDDTVLQSSILDWKTAAQLAFLHNARTRKPLLGVAELYRALQSGTDGDVRNPIFYVSNSPWNLYDLLEDFFELNAIPVGPMLMRRMGVHKGETLGGGSGHKVERVRMLVQHFPLLRWVLLGDSGQADAETYSQVAREFGDRILAIYIRDVDPGSDSPRDQFVDGFIEQVAGTTVPMLRVSDSVAIAEHALGLGLITADTLPAIAAEVQSDKQRPTPTQANTQAVKDDISEAVSK
ncbi:MAG: phosphatase domain-containing protein [Thermomonas sp.]